MFSDPLRPAPYHATKAANRVMAKIDALLYAKDNIRVNSVHPGFIWTPLVENFLKEQCNKSGLSCEELKKQLDSKHPIGHIGERMISPMACCIWYRMRQNL